MLNEHHCALDGANSRGTAVIANGRVSVRRAPRPGATRATIWVNGIRVFSPGIPPDSVLAEIFAEHVQEIKYENCGSTTVAKNGGNNAIFVTLKPGIAFDLRNGSSVIDAEAANRATPRKP